MSTISVQLSLYPLRQPHLGPTISKALDVFRARGLRVTSGTMSTVVAGESGAVFDALKSAFQSAAALGDVVMAVSISDCCPAPASDPRNLQKVRS